MLKFSILKYYTFLIIVILSASTFSIAQDPAAEISVATRPSQKKSDEDDKGSTVRGRVVYRDSGAPVRRGWIGFRKIREFVETPKKDGELKGAFVTPYYSGADTYVLTNDQGEFEMKNVKAGIYHPILKVRGVLNPGFGDRDNAQFQQIAIDGISEVQTSVNVLRGAAVSGIVSYADGSPIIGATVEILSKTEGGFRYSYSRGNDVTTTTTDDRGAYRLSGLPEGEYVVRVVEPSLPVNSGKGISDYNLSESASVSSELKTYYPSADTQKEAASIQLSLGQEQTDISISVPDRRLFSISGNVIAKSDKKVISGVTLTFYKINSDSTRRYSGNQNRQFVTDATGTWKFEDLPKGKYQISASLRPEYVYENGKSTLKNPEIKYAPNGILVDLEDVNMENVSIELSIEATITGFVSVEGRKPVPERGYFSVVSEDLKNSAGGSFDTLKSGKDTEKLRRSFTIGGISEGRFYFTANTDPDYFVKSARLGSKDLLNETFEVEAGEKIENVEVILSSETGTLKGKVNNLEKNKRTFVILLPSDKNGILAFTLAKQGVVSENGEFTIKAAPGEYTVFAATAENRPNFEKFDEWLAEIRSKSQKATVRLNEITEVALTYLAK